MALEDRDEKQAAPYPNVRDCSHGSLRRSCELCERDARIAELEAEVSEKTRSLMLQVNRSDKLETQLIRERARLKSECEGCARTAELEAECERLRVAVEQQITQATVARDITKKVTTRREMGIVVEWLTALRAALAAGKGSK
jgi:hypothetical protein